MLDDIFTDEQIPTLRIYEAAQRVVKRYMEKENKKIEYVAKKLGTTRGYLYASLDPKQTHKPLSIDRIIAITKLTEDYEIIEELADEFDLILLQRKKENTPILDIDLLADNANIESHDVFKTVKQAIADEVITKNEKDSILKEIRESEKATAELKHGVKNLKVEED